MEWSEVKVTKAGLFSKDGAIRTYLKETRAELNKVSWPTRREALNLTLIVLAVTVFMAALLGLIDYAFAQLMGAIIS